MLSSGHESGTREGDGFQDALLHQTCSMGSTRMPLPRDCEDPCAGSTERSMLGTQCCHAPIHEVYAAIDIAA